MTPVPYLFFNGNCAEAIKAYVDIFGGEIVMSMPASDMPPGEMEIPEDRKDLVMHATVRIGDGYIMASDNIMGTSDAMAGCSVNVSLPTVDQSRSAFERLADGGEVTMPFEPTFWDSGFGAVTDRFGIRWMVGTDQPADAG